MKLQLNPEQQRASVALLSFLTSPDQVFVLQGAGGTGKTQLLKHFRDVLFPQYLQTCRILRVEPRFQDITFTAMTNKAAEAMAELTNGEAMTLHAALSLRVEKDRTCGATRLVPHAGSGVLSNQIVVVDEVSMMDFPMIEHLYKRTCQCKWILVGDPNQLPPVKSLNGCPAFTQFPKAVQATLTQPMRNSTQQSLVDLCKLTRGIVTSLDFSPLNDGLPSVPGVIDHLTREELEPVLLEHFSDGGKTALLGDRSRILAYTNERVLEYNQWLQEKTGTGTTQAGLPVGTMLVNNRAFRINANTGSHGPLLPVERLVSVVHTDPKPLPFVLGNVGIPSRYTRIHDLITGEQFTVQLPEDPEHVLALLKYYKRIKDWKSYYLVEETFPDLRPFFAATVHKAQGSTYKSVLIDLEDLGYCTNPKVLARLLYVAVSRASQRIFLYGKLPDRLFKE